MELEFEGIFAEIGHRVRAIEMVLAGETSDDIPDEGGFSGLVTDENTDAILEIAHMKLWVEKKLGKPLENSPVIAVLESDDKRTRVEIYGVALGADENFFLSRWRNEGEKPSYVLWPKEMFDAQLTGDEETGAPFYLTEGEWE